jgi:hypothetical protein
VLTIYVGEKLGADGPLLTLASAVFASFVILGKMLGFLEIY